MAPPRLALPDSAGLQVLSSIKLPTFCASELLTSEQSEGLLLSVIKLLRSETLGVFQT